MTPVNFKHDLVYKNNNKCFHVKSGMEASFGDTIV